MSGCSILSKVSAREESEKLREGERTFSKASRMKREAEYDGRPSKKLKIEVETISRRKVEETVDALFLAIEELHPDTHTIETEVPNPKFRAMTSAVKCMIQTVHKLIPTTEWLVQYLQPLTPLLPPLILFRRALILPFEGTNPGSMELISGTEALVVMFNGLISVTKVLLSGAEVSVLCTKKFIAVMESMASIAENITKTAEDLIPKIESLYPETEEIISGGKKWVKAFFYQVCDCVTKWLLPAIQNLFPATEKLFSVKQRLMQEPATKSLLWSFEEMIHATKELIQATVCVVSVFKRFTDSVNEVVHHVKELKESVFQNDDTDVRGSSDCVLGHRRSGDVNDAPQNDDEEDTIYVTPKKKFDA